MLNRMFSERLKPIASELPLASMDDKDSAFRTIQWLNCVNDWQKMQECNDAFLKASYFMVPARDVCTIAQIGSKK